MYRPDEMALILEQAKQYTDSQRLAHTETKTLLKQTEILVEATDEGNVFYKEPHIVFFENGMLLTVIWDGVRYKNTSELVQPDDTINAVFVGNRSIMGLGENTGEPYLIVCFEQTDLSDVRKYNAIVSAVPGSHTLTIMQETIHPIPQEYIPPLDRLILNGADGNQYALTITDGAISVAPVTT